MTDTFDMKSIGARIRADNQQNDHCTADPIFLVEKQVKTYGIDVEHDPQIAWLYGDDYTELPPEEYAVAEKYFQEVGEVPACILDQTAYENALNCADESEHYSELLRVGYADHWQFVQCFFTKLAAEMFIENNKHRHHGKLRVYVDSAYRNHEWKAIREHLAACVNPEEGVR